MNVLKCLLCICLGLFSVFPSHSQGFLKKLKDKAEKVLDKPSTGSSTAPAGSNSGPVAADSRSSGSTSNKGGQGLIATPPDVNDNLNNVEKAMKDKNYSDARYSVQQAMLGVELQIGQQILKGLPATVNALAKDTTQDQVTSTGWGWAGLTIQRIYKSKDAEFKIAIVNNAAWMQAINIYFNNAGYAQTNGGEQKWKQTRIKGYKAIIEFDRSSGYKLSIPIGQTSMVVMEGVNFNTEQDMMNAANLFDIDNIKKTLGEK